MDRGLPNLLNELILGEGRLVRFDLIALSNKDVAASLVNIFKQKNLDILCVEGLELLGGASSRQLATPAWRGRVEGGRGGG